MLNRDKLLKEISKLENQLFPDQAQNIKTLEKIWNKICNDPTFIYRASAAPLSLLLPGWNGKLDAIFKTNSDIKNYTTIAIDGSQIYPDRHMPGSGCFLINIGGIILEYIFGGKVKIISEPYLMTVDNFTQTSFSKEIVDLTREKLELKNSLELALEYKNSNPNLICLFDGSLIFWHLESKTDEIRKTFLDDYLETLNQFYENQILIAGFISLPKSREVANLIKFEAENSILSSEIDFSKILDTTVMNLFLEPKEYSNIFSSNTKIISNYPSHLKPHFFYLNVGEEIIRIEIPAWIAADFKKINFIANIAQDQSEKGFGYPICLAQAHEQAVIKGPDRDFFYHLICKIGIEKNKQIKFSQKNIKKHSGNNKN